MMRSARTSTRGFSLLEVMVASAIFTVGLLALVPLFAQATLGVRNGRELTVVKELAQTYVEKIRNQAYTNVGIGTGCPAACTPASVGEANPAGHTVTWSVARVDGTAYNFNPGLQPDPDMKRITVTVVCAACARQNLTVRLTTIISERW